MHPFTTFYSLLHRRARGTVRHMESTPTDKDGHDAPLLTAQPYSELSPEVILEALESVGFEPNGGLLALNSYENRVYQIELEDGTFVVTKFYRPKRWTSDAIREEHAFTFELEEAEISVVAPLLIDAESLFEYKNFQFSVYPRQGGHPPNLENESDLEVLARTIGRLHAVGANNTFLHRPTLSAARLACR